jgi:MFS transporter, DHA1 family, multidrug resistance protein
LTDPEPPPASSWRLTLWSVVLVQAMLSGGATIIGPVIPLLLPDLGVGTSAGIRLWTGVIMAVTPLTAAVSSPLWGGIADHIGRRTVLALTGFAVSGVGLSMAFVETAWQLLALRILMGAFGGFAAAGLTLVSSSAPAKRLGYALGWLSAGQIIGTLVGPVLGGAAADITDSIRAPFVLTALLSLLAGVIALVVVPREEHAGARAAGPRLPLLARVKVVWATPLLLTLFLTMLFANAGLRTAEPLVVLETQRLLGDHAQLATLAGLAVAVSGVGNMAAAPFLGRRSDHIGYRRTLLISLFGAAAATVPQAFVESYPLFIAERFCFGMFVGGCLPPLQALVARATTSELRGAVFGVTSSAAFLGGSLGPLAGGAAAAAFGLGGGFLVAGGLLLACFFSVLVAIPPDKKGTAA